MSGTGPTREAEGEIEFSSEELVEMKVEVAGQEASAAKRKKRALRVPADEVPRSATITTERDLEAIAPVPGDDGDELIDHAFSNGGRAEGEVHAAPRFNAADEVSDARSDDKGQAAPAGDERRSKAQAALRSLPANLQALVRAVAPRRLDSSEMEQLDSDELETLSENQQPDQNEQDEQDDLEPEIIAEPSSPFAIDEQEEAAEELSADDAEEDVSEIEAPRERKRTLPPATPPPEVRRERVSTPVMTPQPNGIAPALAPLSPPPPPGAEADGGLRPRRRRRAKQWFEEIFDDDYLRTLPYLSARQTEREVSFILESLELPPNAAVLDLACGYGRHAMEMAGRGNKVTGLDLSLPLLIRAADAARRLGVAVNFVHGDMREMTFDAEFDAAYCMFTSFGYFDDDTNRKVAANLQRALKPGGKVLIELVNRDYIVGDLPTRVWWQGEGCVVLEEVDFNYFSSRLQVQRSIIFEDGRQVEQEISIRAYSLHEIGKVLHHAGFRVIEVSGGLGLRGKFFGAHSRQLLVLAEKKPQP